MIIGASAQYPAGSTGGSATHTLTEDELPIIKGSFQTRQIQYFHNMDVYNTPGVDNCFTSVLNGGNRWDLAIGSTTQSSNNNVRIDLNIGGGQPFSILNPYKAFYIWERVA